MNHCHLSAFLSIYFTYIIPNLNKHGLNMKITSLIKNAYLCFKGKFLFLCVYLQTEKCQK